MNGFWRDESVLRFQCKGIDSGPEHPVYSTVYIVESPKNFRRAAGIGVPDPVMGEVGRYYIVTKPDTELTEAEIKDYCKQHLAGYKVPKKVVFRNELPLTPVGKIMKSQLIEEYRKAKG